MVTTRIAIDGWPIELADTAGVRQAKEELEKAGVERAHKAAETADLCLWVMDLSENPVWPPPHLRLARLVINKTDLPAKWGPPVGVDAVPVSAQTGAGLDELCEALSHWLVPDPPRAGGALPFPQTICNQITEVLNWCRTGQKERAQAALLTILPEKQPRTEHNNY